MVKEIKKKNIVKSCLDERFLNFIEEFKVFSIWDTKEFVKGLIWTQKKMWSFQTVNKNACLNNCSKNTIIAVLINRILCVL